MVIACYYEAMENTQNPKPTSEKAPKSKRFSSVNRNITLFKDQVDYLETAAKILKISQAEVIRQAVDEHRINHKDDLLEHLSSEIENMKSLKDILEKEPAENWKADELLDYINQNGKLPD